MNRERLLELADVIAPLPYGQELDVAGKPKSFNMASGCGTSCCVSGWAFWLYSRGSWSGNVGSREILGLNHDQAQALFHPPGWENNKWDGERAAHVLRLMVAVGDSVTGEQIRALWKVPWA